MEQQLMFSSRRPAGARFIGAGSSRSAPRSRCSARSRSGGREPRRWFMSSFLASSSSPRRWPSSSRPFADRLLDGVFHPLLWAVLLAIIGVVLLTRPTMSAEAITLVMAFYFIVAGIVDIGFALFLHI